MTKDERLEKATAAGFLEVVGRMRGMSSTTWESAEAATRAGWLEWGEAARENKPPKDTPARNEDWLAFKHAFQAEWETPGLRDLSAEAEEFLKKGALESWLDGTDAATEVKQLRARLNLRTAKEALLDARDFINALSLPSDLRDDRDQLVRKLRAID